jgi:hypothetical protein
MTRMFRDIALVALPTVLVAVLTAGSAAPTLGQPYAPGYQPYQTYQPTPYYRSYSRDRERRVRREEEINSIRGTCKDRRIEATGGTRPTTRWALRAAQATWSRLVTAEFGQEYSDITVSKDREHKCFPGVLGGKACRVAALPCSALSQRDFPQPHN